MIGSLALGIGAPIAADKIRKTWKEALPLLNQMTVLVDPAKTVLKAAALVTVSTAFAQVVGSICAIVNIYSGVTAQTELLKCYRKLGADVEAIRHSIAAISKSAEIMVNHKNQHKFGKHVYEWVKMRSDEESATSTLPAYFFVYHQGTEWRPTFQALNRDEPLTQLCGIFNDLSVMALFLTEFRKHVEDGAVFYVLMPATELFFVQDAISIPAEIGPLCLEGELHNQSGLPYIYVNIPEAQEDLLRNICNIAKPAEKSCSSWGKWIASTSAAWAAGVPAALVAAPGGAVAGAGGAFVLGALCPALGVPFLVGSMLVGTTAAGAGVGVTCALHVGKKVEERWDREETS